MISEQDDALSSINRMYISTYASACKYFAIARISEYHTNFIVLHAQITIYTQHTYPYMHATYVATKVKLEKHLQKIPRIIVLVIPYSYKNTFGVKKERPSKVESYLEVNT